MDLAIQFGNIDALICKAVEFIKHGDTDTGFQAVLNASHALRSIELSEKGDHFAKEIKKRQERCADIIFRGNQEQNAETTKTTIQTETSKLFDLDKVLMVADDTVYLQDIIGLQQAKVTLLQAIFLPAAIPDFVNSTQRWKGILLFGTSGVGKSKVITALNNSIKKTTDVQITFINLTLDVVLGAFHGDTEKILSAIFKAAALRAPIVIFVDEIDSFCSARTKEKQDSETKIINHFLSLLDTISVKTDLVVVGTTNKIDTMDVAFYRRFQKMLYIELPNIKEREQLLESLVGRFQSTASIDFKRLAADTERFSSADLTNLVANTVNRVRGERLGSKVLELMEASKRFNVNNLVRESDLRLIDERDLRKSLASSSPTNKEVDIRRLNNFANEFCGRREIYTRMKSDLSLPNPKMILKKPGSSLLKTLLCFHQFFGNGN